MSTNPDMNFDTALNPLYDYADADLHWLTDEWDWLVGPSQNPTSGIREQYASGNLHKSFPTLTIPPHRTQ